MKHPLTPPDFSKFYEKSTSITESISRYNIGVTDQKGRYLHWDKLRHLAPPGDLSPEEHWLAVKFVRRIQSRKIPLSLKNSGSFSYVSTDFIAKELHWLDQYSGGIIEEPEVFRNEGNRKKFLISSMIEEAFRSSQFEGASTTRSRAKEMLLRKEKPRNNSELMVLNNYIAMQFIKEVKEEPLSEELIFQLHRIVSEGTMDENSSGVFRKDNDVYVIDHRDSVVAHIPPDFRELPKRTAKLCDFINSDSPNAFIHPVIKAIILHFMIGYDHPFADGNGRTARALFYWYCLKNGYWLMEYISISKIINEVREAYEKAYLFTETDDGDITYFIHNQIDVIKKSIGQMLDYVKEKADETGELESMLLQSNIRHLFNSRQLALLRHMFQNPSYTYKIYEHQSYHNVTYQTARSDLLKLSDELGLMKKVRIDSKTYIFVPAEDIKARLEKLKK